MRPMPHGLSERRTMGETPRTAATEWPRAACTPEAANSVRPAVKGGVLEAGLENLTERKWRASFVKATQGVRP